MRPVEAVAALVHGTGHPAPSAAAAAHHALPGLGEGQPVDVPPKRREEYEVQRHHLLPEGLLQMPPNPRTAAVKLDWSDDVFTCCH